MFFTVTIGGRSIIYRVARDTLIGTFDVFHVTVAGHTWITTKETRAKAKAAAREHAAKLAAKLEAAP